jgi:hypothetical protein
VKRELRDFEVFAFATSHAALDAEALLDDLGIGVVPVPVPREVSSGCGIALRLDPADAERAAIYLERAGITVTSRVEIRDV